METTLESLTMAHMRMLGKYEAALLEYKRAVRDDRIEDIRRWSVISTRRLRAMVRLSHAAVVLARSRAR